MRAAVDASEWARALELALDAWRACRAPALADLIDAIAARVDRAALPRRRYPLDPPNARTIHAWWMDHAGTYMATDIAPLVAHAQGRLTKSDPRWVHVARAHAGDHAAGQLIAALNYHAGTAFEHPGIEHFNAIDRLAAILSWPDDPRVAQLLVGWLVTAPVRWDPLSAGGATDVFYDALVQRLAAIGDARVTPALRECAAAPRGPTKALRALQKRLAERALAAIVEPALPARDAGSVAEMRAALAAIGPLSPARPTEELWRACRDPKDVAPRLVLADALQEAGDARGELIALQIDGGAKAAARARKLLSANWETWLGDLALVLNRRGTEFRNGMLEIARVGVPQTPEWAFTRVHGHRELATVHTIRPGHVRPADYAAFLDDATLAIDHLAVDAPEVVDELAAVRPRWTVRALDYGHYSIRDGYRYEFPPLARTFATIAKTFPDLEEIRFDAMPWPQHVAGELRELIGELPTAFPKLRRIVIDDARHMWNGLGDVERELADIRQMPMVVVARQLADETS